MAWIETIEANDADGKLKKIYEDLLKSRGKIANIHKIHSLNPESLKNHMDLYMNIMFSSSGLKREEREMIAVVVSSANNCKYCINHHGEALNYYWKDYHRVKKLAKNFKDKSLQLNKKEIIMLDYAYNLTKNPEKIKKEYVKNLKEIGFSDENILNINLIISYFNFVNRIVMGLGVEFSKEEVQGYKY